MIDKKYIFPFVIFVSLISFLSCTNKKNEKVAIKNEDEMLRYIKNEKNNWFNDDSLIYYEESDNKRYMFVSLGQIENKEYSIFDKNIKTKNGAIQFIIDFKSNNVLYLVDNDFIDLSRPIFYEEKKILMIDSGSSIKRNLYFIDLDKFELILKTTSQYFDNNKVYFSPDNKYLALNKCGEDMFSGKEGYYNSVLLFNIKERKKYEINSNENDIQYIFSKWLSNNSFEYKEEILDNNKKVKTENKKIYSIE
jgi:hypothetical protein